MCTYQRPMNVEQKATNKAIVIYLDLQLTVNFSEFRMRSKYRDKNTIIVIAIPINDVGENNSASAIIEK